MAMSEPVHDRAADQRPRIPFFVRLFNPLARRLLGVGIPLGPNALLTVRGRTSGQPRTTPVAVVEIGGRRYIIGTFGEVNWVRNLRAAGEATLTIKRRAEHVQANALTPEEATGFFRDILTPYVSRLPFGRSILGALGARDILADPEAAVPRHPVFELKPAASDDGPAIPAAPNWP